MQTCREYACGQVPQEPSVCGKESSNISGCMKTSVVVIACFCLRDALQRWTDLLLFFLL